MYEEFLKLNRKKIFVNMLYIIGLIYVLNLFMKIVFKVFYYVLR